MRPLYVCLALAGCAQATSNPGGGDDTDLPDASVSRVDGSVFTPSDAAVVPVDAPPAACTTMTRNILENSAFEDTPAGVDWNATPIDSTYPIVTNDAGGVPGQTPAYRAWMGGLERSSAANKDVLYQDVAIPPMTSKLELKGYYEVRTGEFGSGVYDRAVVELTSTTNARLELVRELDDNGATTAWTAFTKTFTGSYSGMTVRVRLSTASDSFAPTSFFFDSFELLATYCQ